MHFADRRATVPAQPRRCAGWMEQLQASCSTLVCVPAPSSVLQCLVILLSEMLLRCLCIELCTQAPGKFALQARTRTRGRHVAGTVFAVFASQGGFQEELVLAPSPLGQGALGPHRPIRGFGRVSPTQEPAHQAKPRPTMARHGAAICCQCGQEDPNIRMAPPGMAPPRNARPTTVLRIGSNMQWGICELCVLMVRLQDWARDGDAEVRLSLQSVFRATLQDLDSRHSVWHWRLRRGDWECGRCHHLNVNWHRQCGLCWVEPPPTPARHSLLVPAGTLHALVLQSGHASSQSGDRPISGELSAQLGPPWEGAQFSAEGASSSGMQWRR